MFLFEEQEHKIKTGKNKDFIRLPTCCLLCTWLSKAIVIEQELTQTPGSKSNQPLLKSPTNQQIANTFKMANRNKNFWVPVISFNFNFKYSKKF